MAISLSSIQKSVRPRAPRILIYGVAGVGKSTFGAGAPKPVFIRTEDGLGTIEVDAFPVAKTFQDVIDAIAVLGEEKHDFRTVVVDSVDWLEPLVWAQTAADNGWKDIEAPGFGKGYAAALDRWKQYLDSLDTLRNDVGMNVIQIAHADIKRFDSPEHDPYDRYQIKLQTRASALIQEHSDIVGFANYRISTTKADVGFSKKVNRAVGGDARMLYVTERPAYLAKNRYQIDKSLDLSWAALEAAMNPKPAAKAAAAKAGEDKNG